MNSHANSRTDAFDVALIGLSTRALARSARRAGLRALCLDLFADADTQEHATLAVRVDARKRGFGFAPKALIAALERHAPAGLPVVFGAGFEDAAGLMAEIGRRHPIRGAAPETVTRLKDPFGFAELLASLGVAHPEVKEGGVEPFSGWLSKRIGASGGAHIHAADGRAGRRRYAQRLMTGSPFSALFLADGQHAHVIGFSEQWADPTPASPFRYGGAVGPIAVPDVRHTAIANALDRIVAATGLVGLASADMLAPVDGGAGFTLLEINPRPGATLDVFERGGALSLLAAHLAACDGRLPSASPATPGAQAAAVVYAPHRTSVAGLERPSWTADWPADDDTIPAGAPVCTVFASAPSPTAARDLVARRRAALLASLPFARRTAAVRSSKTMVSA